MDYKPHKVAEMFPMLPEDGEQFRNLMQSIEDSGQLEPITLDGDVIIDGRNRLRCCQKLGIEPITQQWEDLGLDVDQDDWVFDRNANRRHLTEDQYAALQARYDTFQIEKINAEQRLRAQFAKGECPNTNGRAGKAQEQVNTNSYSPVPAPRDTKQMNANSTVGRIAAKAGVSHHKAAQAVKIVKAEDQGKLPSGTVDKVVSGSVKLKDAAAQVPKVQPAKARPQKPLRDRVIKALENLFAKFPGEEDATRKILNELL